MLGQNTHDYPDWNNNWIDTPDEISLEIEIPESVELSKRLSYNLILTNKSEYVLQLGAGGSTTNEFDIDLIVINKSDRMIWSRFPTETVYQAILFTIILKPGEEYIISDEWDLIDLFGDRIQQGNYKLIAGIHGLEVNQLEKTADDQIVVTESMNYFSTVVSSIPYEITVK
jgi:hypothetical protein